MPGGHIVGQPGYGLQLIGFESRSRYLGLRGQLRGVEETAERDGNLLGEHEAHLAGELMLAADPGFVCRGFEIEDRVPAHGRGGKTGHQQQEEET